MLARSRLLLLILAKEAAKATTRIRMARKSVSSLLVEKLVLSFASTKLLSSTSSLMNKKTSFVSTEKSMGIIKVHGQATIPTIRVLDALRWQQ